MAFLRSGRALVLLPQGQYGPKLQVLDPIQTDTADGYKSQVKFVAKALGNKGVSD